MTVDETKGQESTSELNKMLNGGKSNTEPSSDTASPNVEATNKERGNASPSSNEPSIEEATVIEGEVKETDQPQKRRSKARFNVTWLLLGILTGGLVVLGSIVMQLQNKTIALESELINLRNDTVVLRFYPYDDVVSMLKAQGYNMNAINQYNKNMIRILNAQGITVIPKAMVDGEVPINMIAELMTVEEMNRLANE
ncbi:hypothetical protein J4N45_10945 [Vibrio sp. SCSIO 43140]|uniref:hypothetical protein n=1 Tax=Vibrio sp. SCSIO 43140 TaxID=2819100 RepID=UPI00207651F0|nr:hypothetical protein [Vibrio sp. SCSIO 43140]USD59047.1 hypothetical protein J4N45_10945 [Vibrio sp. SCSIO 43140]